MEETRLKNPVIRRAQRLFTMLHELHKQGYQRLGIHAGMSASGTYWRCSIVPIDCLYCSQEGNFECIELEEIEPADYSTGDANLYCGWEDSREDTARTLAAKFLQRFPRLSEAGRGADFQYSGWFTYMLGQSELGNLPVMYADYYAPDFGQIRSLNNETLAAPPHPLVHQDGDIRYARYAVPNHLIMEGDWHDIYVGIIDRMASQCRQNQLILVPSYPLPADIEVV